MLFRRIQFILFTILITTLTPAVEAKRQHPESYYQLNWCNAKNGILEYQLNDKTRIDCLLPNMAVEFDFADKWAECAGQALYYGLKTNRQSACVLIMENGKKDLKYLKRLRKVAYKKGIRTFTIKSD